jgi:hypothetical protein
MKPGPFATDYSNESARQSLFIARGRDGMRRASGRGDMGSGPPAWLLSYLFFLFLILRVLLVFLFSSVFFRFFVFLFSCFLFL